MKKNAPLLLALFILVPAVLLAQQRQIKGKITDEAGVPIPDVSVGVKGNPAQTRSAAVLTVMAAFDASDDVANKMTPITANDIIYPIAQAQLSVSPGLYTQNPGY